ncbi:carboxypeptidase-like regulatory domain-containing protein [Stieleria marina]|uniref:Cna protein B-type domain protein n=1 Tax=Stieleria marina TaxID=1930275 RepID=A0A517NMQ3_9BACT|nr:hypothetical protein K239x_02910 [Planctomycetes bacterium K23_9]
MSRLMSLFCLAACLVALPQAGAEDSKSVTSADLTINQWVLPAEPGTLTGRIVAASADGSSVAVANANVAIVDKSGKVLRGATLTNAKGEFVIKDAQPGVYALSARSGNFFAACAMHVLSDTQAKDGQFASAVEVSAAAIEYKTLQEAIVRYLPTSSKPAASAVNPVIAGNQLPELAETVAAPEAFRVAQVNGGMLGQIFSAGVEGTSLPNAQTTNVFILKDGAEVARTVTSATGDFQIEKLGLGNYSLMAIGPQGLGVMGFELVNENDLKTSDNVSSDGERYVGLFSRLRARRCARKCSIQVAPVCNSCDTCAVGSVVAVAPVFQPVTTIAAVAPVNTCGCGQPVATCGCGIPVDPCGCGGGTVIADAGYVESIPMEGQIVDGTIIDGGIVDGGIIDGGIVDGGFVDGMPIDGFGGGGGYAPGYGGGGGFSGGGGGYGGGGGGLLGGGGLGGIAALAGIGGIILATTDDDDDNVIQPAPIASPVFPN